jgi:hypothetical protein
MNKVCKQIEKATGALSAFDGSKLLFMSAPIADAPVRIVIAHRTPGSFAPLKVMSPLTSSSRHLFFLPQLTITAMLTDDDVEQFLGESPAAPIAAAVGKQAGKGAAAAAATAAASAASAATGKEFTVRFAATAPCEVPLAPLVQFFDGGARDASVATPREQLQALDIVVKTLFSGTVRAGSSEDERSIVSTKQEHVRVANHALPQSPPTAAGSTFDDIYSLISR